MDVSVLSTDNDIIRRGACILRQNEFYRSFLDLFARDNMRIFLEKQARCDAEWQSIRFFIKLRTYINDALGYNAGKETMAYYINAIMKHPVLRRTAHTVVREKKFAPEKNALCASKIRKITNEICRSADLLSIVDNIKTT